MSKIEYNIAWSNQKLQIRWRRISHPHKHCRISLVYEPSSEKSNDSASQTNIYRSFTTLRFCVTPIRSSIDKIELLPCFFLHQECACFLAGPGACGLWPISSLVVLELIIRKLIIVPTSNFLVFLNPSNCTVFLPSIGTKLGHDYSDSSWSFH